MPTYDFSKYTLYRWRYGLGYGAVGVLLIAVLLFAGLFLPGGLSADEMNSVVTSHSLQLSNPTSLAVSNLPYHAFQAFILQVLGITIFTIKLPSLILAFFSALGLIFLLRRWFRRSIAILGSLIAISSSQFLFIAQSGTPDIMFIFWPVVLLLLGTQVTRVHKWRFMWKILFSITAALSLYTPLGIYSLLTIGLAIVLHPHLRTIIRRLSKRRLAVISVLFAVLTVPLLYLMFLVPSLGLELLGAPSSWPPNFVANLALIAKEYLIFWQPSGAPALFPVFGFGSAVLICFGLYRIIRTHATTRSYLIIIWLACLLFVSLINPTFTAASFVPLVLLLTAGIQPLFSYWYRLFPINPYARVAGLFPIGILVLGAIALGMYRYAYGYHYSPPIVSQFSKDLALLPHKATRLVVADTERAFWEAVASYRKNLEVTTTPSGQYFVTTQKAYPGTIPGYIISQIVTNSLSSDADRFYIYQKTTQ